MSTKSVRLKYIPAAIAAGFGVVSAAYAAEDTPVETIVVTAQSRSQSVREVPIAISVISEKQIQDLGAENLADLNGYVPGLAVDSSQATQPNFQLRGIGTADFGVGTDAPVGIYVDGVYTGKTGGSLMNFNDVQRVEVLKGPQGTLFGRNSAAGAISIITNEPGRATEADATLRAGRFNTRVADAMVNLPTGDNTAVRFSVADKKSDGWVTNETTGQKLGGDSAWGTRAAFKWSPTAETKLVASWEHEKLDQTSRPAFGLVRVPSGTMPAIPATAAEMIDPLNAPLQNDGSGRETRTFDGLNVHFETPLSGLKFSSTTAYRHFRSYNATDVDGTANPVTYLTTTNDEKNSSFQQEFKLASKNDQLDWIAGLSFYRVNADQTSTVGTNTDSIDTLMINNPLVGAALFANPATFNGFGLGNPWSEQMINTSRTTSYSLYGDLIWHLSTDTNLTTGLRATSDHKEVSWYVPPYSAPALDAQFQSALGGTFAQVTAASPTGPINNIVFADAAAYASSPLSASHSWTDLSPRLVLDHKLSRDTMVFASVSRGYQAGGFDVFSPNVRFEPEHMTNVEVGVKSALPELHASFEGSLFHYKFSNLQSIALQRGVGAAPVYVVSTSDQSASGIDLSGKVQVAKGVSLFGSAEYLDQKYDHYAFADHLTGSPVSLDGKPVGTPSLTITGGTRLTWASFGGETEFVLQGSHTTATRCNAQITQEYGCLSSGPVQTGTAQTRVDLRLGWQTSDLRYGVALLVNNALNKQYVEVVPNAGESAFIFGTPYSTVTPPRFVGVEVHASM